MNGGATARDYAWASLAGVMAVFTLLNLAACLYFLLRGEFLVLLRIPVGLLFGYWIAMGAWRRTCWGRPALEPGVTAGGVLPPEHVARMTALAVGCVIAIVLALGFQALLGRW